MTLGHWEDVFQDLSESLVAFITTDDELRIGKHQKLKFFLMNPLHSDLFHS